MKKITFFTLLVFSVSLVAQTNLIQNPGFETWTNGKPEPWYIVGTPTGYTMSQSTAIFNEGTSSVKFEVPSTASGTISLSQVFPIVPGGNYTLTLNYYVELGDNTDARIWCNFKKGTAFYTEAELVATNLYSKLRGPGNSNSSGNSYLPDVKGSWQVYTTTFTAPADADGFDFQVRTYKGAVVYWDNMSLTGPVPSSIFSPKTESLNVSVQNGKIVFEAAQGETVEVFNAVGQKLLSQPTVDGKNELMISNKGVTVVRIANRVGKVML